MIKSGARDERRPNINIETIEEDLMKRRQNTHQHTRVQHLWGLLSVGCCLVTEGPVGSNWHLECTMIIIQTSE